MLFRKGAPCPELYKFETMGTTYDEKYIEADDGSNGHEKSV